MKIYILGASSSIARKVAAIYARRGDELVLAGRDQRELTRVAADLRIRFNARVDVNASHHGCDMLLVAAGYIGPDADATERGNYSDLLPTVDAFKGRRIVILSSVAAVRLRKSNYAYGLAKQKLNEHVRGWPNVTIVLLGPVDTEMTFSSSKPTVPAEVAAKGIVRVIDRGDEVAYVPKIWRPIMMLVKRLPQRLADRL